MKAIIPAAGFGTRLYPLTLNKPKALLDVGEKKMIEHVIEKIEELGVIDEIIIVSNAKFFQQFLDWKKAFHSKTPITILNDGAVSDETRKGGVFAYHFAIKKRKIKEPVLLVSSDNIFNFSIKPMFEHFCKKGCDVIALYDVGSMEEAKKMGIAEIDANKKVIGFVEKPPVPKTTLCSIGIYLYTKETVKLFEKYIAEGNSPDKPGQFLEWLHKRKHVEAFIFDEPHHRWYDIGTIEMLEKVRKEYCNAK